MCAGGVSFLKEALVGLRGAVQGENARVVTVFDQTRWPPRLALTFSRWRILVERAWGMPGAVDLSE